MFTRSFIGHPFQPLTFGASPFASVGGITPFPSQMTGYNPYQAAQVTGGVPVPAAHLMAGLNPALNPAINPLVAAQLAAVNPGILPNLVPQVWGGPFGQYSNPGMINPLFQQLGSETSPYGQSQFGQSPFGQSPFGQSPYGQSPFGQSPYGQSPFGQSPYGQSPYGQSPFGQSPYGQSPFGQSPFGQSLTGGLQTPSPYYGQFSPYGVQDPIAASVLAQQLNPMAQQRLPIRPLTGLQQVDPYQVGLSGLTGLPISQTIDPYSALTQAQLMSQYGINPFQQMPRTYTLGNWPGSPHSMWQPSTIGQMGVPYCP